MRVIKIENGTAPIEGDFDILVSELPLTYLQGIRDAKCVDAILIGSNGAEIQMRKSDIPFYTNYKTIEESLKGLE